MKYIIILSLLFGFTFAGAQEFKSDAVFEKIVKEYTLHEDGSMEYHYYKKVKLNTHFSFNRLYGETFIVYDPNNQELTINKAETTQKDGNIVKSPENAFNEVLPRFAANAPYFNHLREMVVTHTGLEVGAVIELDYTLVSHADYFPGLMGNELITESSPVQEEEIIIRIPKGMELNYRVLNVRTGPQIIDSDENRVYLFKFNGIKENSHEYHQPSNDSHLPRLVFSTLNLETAINYLSIQEALNYKTNKSMQESIQELKQDKTDDLLLILEIQKLVANNINTYRVPDNYTGFRIRNPIEVWESNGGTQLEKTILLTALLREAGIHAEPVATIPSKYFDKTIGCFSMIREYLVQVNPREREQMYISATFTSDQNLVYSIDGATIVIISPEKFFVDPISDIFENQVISNGQIIFDDSMKFSGSIETLVTEKLNPYYKLKSDSNFVKSMIGSGISTGDIKSFEIINTAQYRSLAKVDVTSKKPVRNQVNYYFWQLPVNKRGTESWRINYLNSDRVSNFEIPEVINEQYSFEITLPDSVELLNPQELIEITNEFGELVISTTQTENKVTIKRLLKINKKEVNTQNYPDFKEMFDLWNDKKKRELVMKVNNE